MRRAFHVWPGAGVPCSRTEEAVLVARLAHLGRSGPSPRPDRDAATVLMSLLRSGADLDASLEVAPGLPRVAPRLHATYLRLERARSDAEAGWAAVRSARSYAELCSAASAASPLLSLPAAVLMSSDPDGVMRLRPGLVRRVEEESALAAEVEARLRALPSVPPERTRMLLGSSSPGVFESRFFLPDRLAACPPVTVARLVDSAGIPA